MGSQDIKKLQNLCRLCAQHDSVFVDIFGENGLKQFISKKIRICLPVLITEDDPKPRQICLSCLNMLDTSYELFKRCIKAQKTIENIITNGLSDCNTEYEEEDAEFIKTTSSLQQYVKRTNETLGKHPFKKQKLEEIVVTSLKTGDEESISDACSVSNESVSDVPQQKETLPSVNKAINSSAAKHTGVLPIEINEPTASAGTTKNDIYVTPSRLTPSAIITSNSPTVCTPALSTTVMTPMPSQPQSEFNSSSFSLSTPAVVSVPTLSSVPCSDLLLVPQNFVSEILGLQRGQAVYSLQPLQLESQKIALPPPPNTVTLSRNIIGSSQLHSEGVVNKILPPSNTSNLVPNNLASQFVNITPAALATTIVTSSSVYNALPACRTSSAINNSTSVPTDRYSTIAEKGSDVVQYSSVPVRVPSSYPIQYKCIPATNGSGIHTQFICVPKENINSNTTLADLPKSFCETQSVVSSPNGFIDPILAPLQNSTSCQMKVNTVNECDSIIPSDKSSNTTLSIQSHPSSPSVTLKSIEQGLSEKIRKHFLSPNFTSGTLSNHVATQKHSKYKSYGRSEKKRHLSSSWTVTPLAKSACETASTNLVDRIDTKQMGASGDKALHAFGLKKKPFITYSRKRNIKRSTQSEKRMRPPPPPAVSVSSPVARSPFSKLTAAEEVKYSSELIKMTPEKLNNSESQRSHSGGEPVSDGSTVAHSESLVKGSTACIWDDDCGKGNKPTYSYNTFNLPKSLSNKLQNLVQKKCASVKPISSTTAVPTKSKITIGNVGGEKSELRQYAASKTKNTQNYGGEQPESAEGLCPYCNKSFTHDILAHHKALHFREPFYSCIDCSKNFWTAEGLSSHNCKTK